jgi:hypothetical protein
MKNCLAAKIEEQSAAAAIIDKTKLTQHNLISQLTNLSAKG